MVRLAPFLCAFVALPLLAASIPVSQPDFGPAPRDQYNAAVASDGNQYLVMWADERAETKQAYATRLSPDGTVLDPNGIRVASDALTYYPQVIWGGSSWFVLANTCSSIEFARVARNGSLLDSEPRLVPVSAWCPGMSVASNGQYVAVGYVSGHSTYEMHALILDSDGEAVTDIRLATGETQLTVPAITANGSSFVAVWDGRAVRFDHTGILDPVRDVPALGLSSGALSMASDGTGMVLVRGNVAFRMNDDLVAEHLLNLPFTYVKSIAWTGSSYIVTGVVPAYQNGTLHEGDVNVVRLDGDGRMLAQQEVRAGGSGAHPLKGSAMASNGRNVVIAWHDPTEALDHPYADSDIYASVASLPDLTMGPRKVLSVAADSQLRPATAASGNHHLTVWQEESGLYARRHWRDGRSDGAPIRLTDAHALSMDVVFNGSAFLLASTEGNAVVIRRLTAAGELRVDREWRSDDARYPGPIALSSSGGTTLMAWRDGGVHAARIGAEGAPIDETPLEVAAAPLARTAHRIAISPNGSGEFLVVWGGSTMACIYCSPSMLPEAGPVRAARVTAALTRLDHPAIEIVVPGVDTLHADHPSVTWNGNEWLVVWNRAFSEAGVDEWIIEEEIRGRRVARNGTLLDGSRKDPGILIARNGFAPTIAWTGSAYLLGWYDGSAISVRYPTEHTLQRIRIASLDRLGGSLSDERTLGESPATDPISISVANGLASMAYSRLGEDALYGGVSRVFLEFSGSNARRRAVRR